MLPLFCVLGCQVPPAAQSTTTEALPNFILIYADDLGYGDLGCFGSTKNRTPRLDQMAREGVRLTSFYSTSGVCTPMHTASIRKKIGFATGSHSPALGSKRSHRSFTY